MVLNTIFVANFIITFFLATVFKSIGVITLGPLWTVKLDVIKTYIIDKIWLWWNVLISRCWQNLNEMFVSCNFVET